MKLIPYFSKCVRALLPVCIGLCGVFAAPAVCAAQQPSAQLPSYDAVTIRINSSGSDSASARPSHGAFSATNMTLPQLLQGIYGIRPDLISGMPASLEPVRFDITAKVSNPDPNAPPVDERQLIQMMLPVLAERFHLRTHFETKLVPTYDLVVREGGSKLQVTTETSPAVKVSMHAIEDQGRELTARNVPMAGLANALGKQLHHSVHDKTGLIGKYDFTLRWADDNATSSSLPSIFTAVSEQLGLKLQSAKGPEQALVIDQVEMPTPN